ncbi:MAG: transposase [Paenibacillus sp.]|nr:transposase [Paenibacillus sp.]
MNQDNYVNTLAQAFHPWFRDVIDKTKRAFILQEDGATCHTGNYARWWKESHQIRDFEYWPAQSPDLNPIEHIWHSLEMLIEKRRTSIHNMNDLKADLEEERRRMDIEFAQRLVASMSRRCQAVIVAKGGPTKY